MTTPLTHWKNARRNHEQVSLVQIRGIHQIAVKADNLDEMVAFYQEVLSADLLARFDPPGLAFFDFGGTRVLLEESASPSTLYYRVDDIQSAYQELLEKGRLWFQRRFRKLLNHVPRNSA